jgi:hypothetical protein
VVGLVVAGLVQTLVLPGTSLNPVGTLVVSDTPACAVESLLLYHLRTRTVACAAAGTCGDQLAPLSVEYSSVLVVAAEAGTAPIVTDTNVAADIAVSTPSATTHLAAARRRTRRLWRLFGSGMAFLPYAPAPPRDSAGAMARLPRINLEERRHAGT